MTANTRFITAERKNVLKVPLAAVRFRPAAGVTVIGDTNAPTAKGASGAALIESGPLPACRSCLDEREAPAHGCGADCLCRNPDSGAKAEYEKATAEFRARMAQGGGQGGPGSGGGGSGAVPAAALARDHDPNPPNSRQRLYI